MYICKVIFWTKGVYLLSILGYYLVYYLFCFRLGVDLPCHQILSMCSFRGIQFSRSFQSYLKMSSDNNSVMLCLMQYVWSNMSNIEKSWLNFSWAFSFIWTWLFIIPEILVHDSLREIIPLFSGCVKGVTKSFSQFAQCKWNME